MSTNSDTRGEREAARIIALALRQDASAHEAGDLAAIGERYDEVYAEAQSSCSDLSLEIGRAILFWDEWADARNHEWRYYPDIARDDWPRLARHLADALEAGVPISAPELVRHFERIERPGWLARLFGRKGGPA